MKRRDFLTAEVIDDTEELMNDWMFVIMALKEIEDDPPALAYATVVSLLNENIS